MELGCNVRYRGKRGIEVRWLPNSFQYVHLPKYARVFQGGSGDMAHFFSILKSYRKKTVKRKCLTFPKGP